ncbi:hypothetical protein [Methanobacterium sp. MBAC-LM]|uniref:hypothetical protein n=1 Tax=Methanobacterium sp. MBAC-LM TaxID=3412034 RepID=UPI003C740799
MAKPANQDLRCTKLCFVTVKIFDFYMLSNPSKIQRIFGARIEAVKHAVHVLRIKNLRFFKIRKL